MAEALKGVKLSPGVTLHLNRKADRPYAIKIEIRLATFDLWRLLCLQAFIIADANQRGTIVNRRRRELSKIHEQLSEIDARFLRRVEALDLGKGGTGLDLASRLAAAQRAQEEHSMIEVKVRDAEPRDKL